jgi:CheY-like chemotaxis protein
MILTGWKSIARHLQCGVRSAQRWEMDLGLPIKRPAGGERHLVFAFSEELDDWVGRNPSPELVPDDGNLAGRQVELRDQLKQLRVRQKQLIAQLRESTTAAKKRAHDTNQGIFRHRQEALDRTASREHSPSNSKPSPSPAVLAVDDNVSHCYTISRVLRAAGFQVFEAHNAAEALEIAIRETPNLALVDIHLPDFNGYELFALLRQQPRLQQMPVIFQTASAPVDAAQMLTSSLRADGLICHPVKPSLLISLIEETISRNGTRQAAADLSATATPVI